MKSTELWFYVMITLYALGKVDFSWVVISLIAFVSTVVMLTVYNAIHNLRYQKRKAELDAEIQALKNELKEYSEKKESQDLWHA